MDAKITGRRYGTNRPQGKHFPEKRQGFVIYLPRPVHTKLREMSASRHVTMSELAATAVAQYLGMLEEQPATPPEIRAVPVQRVSRPTVPQPLMAPPRAPGVQSVPDFPATPAEFPIEIDD